MRHLVYATLLCLAPLLPVHAGTPKDAPATLMLTPGKVLVSEDLNQPFGKDWFANKGKWEVVDGAMRAAELPSDEHAAVRRKPVKFTSAVIRFDFKFDGATTGSLSMNADKGHVCRVRFSPEGFSIVKDADKKNKVKGLGLDSWKVAMKPGVWHTMVVEMAGSDMVVRLDGKDVAYGSNDALKTPKASVGFTVKGSTLSFKNLRVYEGTPAPGWEAEKVKLLATRKK